MKQFQLISSLKKKQSEVTTCHAHFVAKYVLIKSIESNSVLPHNL